MEHVWEDLREKHLLNRAFPSLDEVVDAVCDGLQQLEADPKRLRSMIGGALIGVPQGGLWHPHLFQSSACHLRCQKPYFGLKRYYERGLLWPTTHAGISHPRRTFLSESTASPLGRICSF